MIKRSLCLAFLLSIVASTLRADQYVNVVANNLTASGTAITVNITTLGGSGSELVIGCGENNTASGATITMSDSASNTWSQVGSYQTVGTQTFGMFRADNAAAVTSVTCTWNGISSTRVAMTVAELFGSATSSVVDGTPVGSTQASGTSMGSGNTTTAQANTILIYTAFNITGGSDALTNSFTFPANGIGARIDLGCRAVSSTGTYSTTLSWGATATASGMFAAFKGNTGTTSCTPPVGGAGINKKAKLSKLDMARWTQPARKKEEETWAV